MIDLKNTYIENVDGELKDLFAKECHNQGIPLLTPTGPNDTLHQLGKYLTVHKGKLKCISQCYDYKKVTLADLKPKPRTKTEYVECDKLQVALNEFQSMDGIEFYSSKDGGDRINSVRRLAFAYGNASLYRKVETEITWKDEVNLFLDKANIARENGKDSIWIGNSTWSHSDLIRFGHLVASMTDKPE